MDESTRREIHQEWMHTLEGLEKEILAWETGKDQGILQSIRRSAHTFKGECGMLGFPELSLVCHELESYLEKGDTVISVDSLLEAVDWFKNYFSEDGSQNNGNEVATAFVDRVFAKGAAFPRKKKSSDPTSISWDPVSLADTEMAGDFVAEYAEHLDKAEKEFLDVESRPEEGHKESYDTIFRAFHSIKGMAAMMNLEDIRALAHSSENLLDLARQGLIEKNREWIEVAFTSIDRLRHLMEEVRANIGEAYQPSSETYALAERINLLSARLRDGGAKPLGQILVEQGSISKKELDAVLTKQLSQGFEKKTGELLVEGGQVSAVVVAEALEKQANKTPGAAEPPRETVKVDVARLDALIDAIGELVISQSMLAQSLEGIAHGHPTLSKTLRSLEKGGKQVQEMSLGLRMISVRPLFEKMHRLVRDLSKKTGKPVQLKISGEDTELDRSMVERLADPLMHMIRNAVDHGIESDPAERLASGKPAQGTIELRAFHKEGKVHIEIADDGKGIAEERVLKKALEKKLIPEGAKLSRQEILDLIFLPGFSTATQVTELSGRGVGMDVVKRNIQAIRGRVDIDSHPGRGTSFRVALPLTLAMIEGLLVRVGSEKYVVPMLEVLETIRPREKEITSVMGKGETVTLRDKVLPLFRLSRILDIQDAEASLSRSTLLISESSRQNVAVAIDEVLGLHQILIKPLDSRYEKIRGLSGCAILPDGAVHFILELRQLCQLNADINGLI